MLTLDYWVRDFDWLVGSGWVGGGEGRGDGEGAGGLHWKKRGRKYFDLHTCDDIQDFNHLATTKIIWLMCCWLEVSRFG